MASSHILRREHSTRLHAQPRDSAGLHHTIEVVLVRAANRVSIQSRIGVQRLPKPTMVDGVRDEALGYAALRLWTVARLKYIQQAHVGWVLWLGEVFRLHDWLPVIDRAAL